MGCWNASCAISGLPIFEDEEVYAMFIGDRADAVFLDHRRSFCDADEIWSPFGWIFKGEYNDYGALKNCSGMFQPTLEAIREHLVEMPLGDNKCHDIEVTKALMVDEKFLFEANHEDRLRIKTYRQYNLHCVYFKKNIFEAIVKKISKDKCMDWTTTNRSETTMRKAIHNEFESMFGSLRPGMDDDPLADYRSISLSSGTYTRWLFGNMYAMTEQVRQAYKTDDKKLQKEIEEQTRLFMCLRIFMDRTRRSWVPPSGGGSQDSETELHELLANEVLKESKLIKHRWDE